MGDRGGIEARLAELGYAVAEIIEQHDIFFACERGRLKLRIFSPSKGELIAYDRPDQAAAKLSRYIIAPTSDPDRLRQALTAALGVIGEVRKTRTLYLIGQTRVHLDAVEGWGFHRIGRGLARGPHPQRFPAWRRREYGAGDHGEAGDSGGRSAGSGVRGYEGVSAEGKLCFDSRRKQRFFRS